MQTPSFDHRPALLTGAVALWGQRLSLREAVEAASGGDFRAWSVLLHLMYGSPPAGNPTGDPVGGLFLLICSPRARETSYLAAWARLRSICQGDWPELVRHRAAVAEAVARLPAGRQTARRVLRLAGVPDLEAELHHIATLPPQAALEALETLPGVGPKVARCWLLYHAGLDLVPVDTHTARVSVRLGLAPAELVFTRQSGVSPSAGPALDARCPLGHAYAWHMNTLAHGQAVCGNSPACPSCALSPLCPRVGVP